MKHIAAHTLFVAAALTAASPLFAETPDKFVRYVESTGSQYVDTGVTGRWNTKVEAQVEWLELGDRTIIGSRIDSGNTRLYFCHCYNGNDNRGYNFDGNMLTAQGAYDTVTWNGGWICRWTKNRIYDYTAAFSATNGEGQATNTINVDGLDVWSKASTGLDTGLNLHLFACNVGGTASYKSKARIYGLKIWQGPKDGGDMTLQRDLVPCMKNGKAGLYDAVSGDILYGSGADLVCDEDSETPDEFVEYVESTSYGYIDTEINAQSGTSAEIDLAVLTTRSRNKSVLGAYKSDGDMRFYLLYCNQGVMRYGYGGLSSGSTIYSVGDRYLVEASLSAGSQTLERTNVDASTEKTVLASDTDGTVLDMQMPLHLFACNRDGEPDWAGQFRLYGCKIRQNGVLVRDFKPCLKDGEFALFDDVSKRIFHAKRGFLNGPVNTILVGRNAKIKFVEYIESSGWETLDTGVRARAGTRAKGDFAYTDIQGMRYDKYRYLREPVNPTEHRVFLGADNPEEWPTYFFPVSCKSQSESDNNRWLYGDYGSDSTAHGAYATTDGSTKIQVVSGAKHSFDASFMDEAQTIELDGTNVWSLSNDADFDSGKNLHIFSSGSRYRSAARCYGLEIWQDGNKVRDFKPCVYDGKAMLYDTISKTLYRPSPDIPESKAGPVVFTGEEKPVCYVDYVESDGTIFVDTGVTGKSGTKADLKLQFKEKADRGFLDSRTGDSRFYLIHNGANNNVFYIGYGKAQSFSPCAINTDYTVQSELSVGRQEVTVDGVSKWTTGQTTTYINPSDNINTGYNLYLFAMNQDGSPTYAGQARLYYLKLYQGDSDGSNMQLVRNLRPVRLSNDVVVLWDFVNNVPYRPQLVSAPGTYTTFTSVGQDGEKVSAPFIMVIR